MYVYDDEYRQESFGERLSFTRCNTLRYTWTYYNTLQYSAKCLASTWSFPRWRRLTGTGTLSWLRRLTGTGTLCWKVIFYTRALYIMANTAVAKNNSTSSIGESAERDQVEKASCVSLPLVHGWGLILCCGRKGTRKKDANTNTNIYLYMHVCVCVYISMCVHVHVWICMYIYMYVYICVFIYVCTYM